MPTTRLLALLLGLAAAQLPAKPPNILFILADDLGIGGLHCYGNEHIETPNIDRLCGEGMKFTRGLAAYPTCKPSRAAILSGQYGPRTGVYRVVNSYGDEDKARYLIPKNRELSPEKITLGTVFRRAGYATAMFGKWHVSNEKQRHPGKLFGFDEAFVSAGAHYKARSTPPVDLPDGMMMEELFTTKASAFMVRAVRAEKPFFLYMPYFLVHRPLEARQDYIDHFREKLKGSKNIDKKPDELPVIMAMTKMLDDFVGQLLETLRTLDIEDDTIVLFTSDNGAYDRNLVGICRGRKGDTYDGGMRVPYIFKWPGKIPAASICSEPVIGVDLYPTFLALAGIDPPASHPLDGTDLSPLLLGKSDSLAPRQLYCFYPKYARYNPRSKRWAQSWRNVIYDGDLKLIEYPEYGEYELFDLATDPGEGTDLSKARPEAREARIRTLHKWLKEIRAPELKPNPAFSR